jgi:hypothetical protein
VVIGQRGLHVLASAQQHFQISLLFENLSRTAMNSGKSILLLCSISLASLFVNAQAAAHLKHHHPLPLTLCLVTVGSSNDSMVVKLYGEGLFDSKDGPGGARYFTDESRKIILKTVIGADKVIKEVALCSSKLPFDFVKDKMQSIPVAKKLNAQSIMMGNIHIGDTKEKIVLQFGTPNKTETMKEVRLLTYEDTHDEWKEVISYKAMFEFKENRLERITFYNGD